MNETFTRMQCCDCGVVFAVESRHHSRLLTSGAKFYCTNGHAQTYGPSEADKLRRQVDMLTKRAVYRDAEIKRLEGQRRAMKGQMTRLRREAKG